MKRLALLLLLLLTVPVSAGSYYNGTVRDGYTYRGGYWYQGNTPYYAYAHTAYNYVPTYYYNSYGGYSTYYSPQAYTYYTYEQAPYEQPQPKAAAPTPPANWKSELLKLAGSRDDYLAYLTALKALGMPQPLQSPYPAQQQGGPAPGYAPGVPYSMNANTLYGYSYSTVKDVYGDTNLNTLYQQAARLTQNAQSLAGQAQGDFSQLVQQEGGNRSRVAEILAKAQAAAAALKAAEAAPGVHVESRASATVSGQQTESGGGAVEVQPGATAQQQGQGGYTQQAQGQGSPQAFAALLQNRCASCHSGNDPAGKLALTPQSYAAMSLADKARVVWPRLTHPDPHKRMPKGDKAQPLSPEELRLFYTH